GSRRPRSGHGAGRLAVPLFCGQGRALARLLEDLRRARPLGRKVPKVVVSAAALLLACRADPPPAPASTTATPLVVSQAGRLAHGRKKVGITVGRGADGWAGLSDGELGLGSDYEVVRLDWDRPAGFAAADAIIVDGPQGVLPRAALQALRGHSVIYLVDEA